MDRGLQFVRQSPFLLWQPFSLFQYIFDTVLNDILAAFFGAACISIAFYILVIILETVDSLLRKIGI
jgi:hypothetical protein